MSEIRFNIEGAFDKKPVATPASYENIEVNICFDDIFMEYVRAIFIKLSYSDRAARIQESVKLNEDEVVYYLKALLKERIRQVNGHKVNWNLYNDFLVPSFFAHSLDMIGVCSDDNRGITMIPVTSDDAIYNDDKLQEIAIKFERLKDCIAVVRGPLSRSKCGDVELMSLACIDGTVKAMNSVSHPLKSYLGAFLNIKLVEQVSYSMLYRIQYDQCATIRNEFRKAGETLC